MSGDDAEERIERLEARLAEVEATLERYREQHALLRAAVDVDALEDPECPACGEPTLGTNSGLTWSRAVCQSCGAKWVLDG